MPVISITRGGLRQEDHKFEASLGYIVNSRPVVLHSKTVS
jgi:hypothetical protein